MLVFQKTTQKSFENIKGTSDGPTAQSKTLAQEILATIGRKEGHVTFSTLFRPDLPIQFTVSSRDKAPETGVRLVDGTVMLNNDATINVAQASKFGVDQTRKIEKSGALLAEALLAQLRKQPGDSETPFREVKTDYPLGSYYFAASGAVLEVPHNLFRADLPEDYESYQSAVEIAKAKLAQQGLEVLDTRGFSWKHTTFVVTKTPVLEKTLASASHHKRVSASRRKTIFKFALGVLVPFFGWCFLASEGSRILQEHGAIKNGHGFVKANQVPLSEALVPG